MIGFVRLVLVLMAALVFTSAAAWAQQVSNVPVPKLPEAAEGTKCLRDNDFMRRNHMKMLLHKRDQTVHDGDRTVEFSLKKCVTCHAVKGENGQPVTVNDPRHFCRTCHDYAAVKIDCFQCHTSLPETAGQTASTPFDPHRTADLYEYLKEVEQ